MAAGAGRRSQGPCLATDARPSLARLASPPRRPLRVAQVVLGLEPGGTERLVIEITRRLAGRAETVVCCLDDPGAWAEELSAQGVSVVPLRRQAGFHPSLAWRLGSVLNAYDADVIHCHQYSPFVYGALARLVTRGSPIVFTEHGRHSDAPPTVKRRLVNPFLSRVPARTYAVSENLRRFMIASGFPASRVGVIHNGVDLGPVVTAAGRGSARRRLAIPAGAPVIGTAARLDPVKDLVTLIEATAPLRATHPDLRLVVIGDGRERRRLEERTAELGLARAVHFTGHVADVRPILPAIDVFVNTSTSEGISLTILEAMAASIPVVATDVGGTPEIVVKGQTGLLVPARDPAAVTRAVVALAADPGWRRSLGRAARSRVERHFTIQGMVDQYFQVYTDLVRRGARGLRLRAAGR